MSTNEVAAVSRLVEFKDIITEATNETVYKILELTKNSYYKIILKETSSTTILEILNGKIYSISTPSNGNNNENNSGTSEGDNGTTENNDNGARKILIKAEQDTERR